MRARARAGALALAGLALAAGCRSPAAAPDAVPIARGLRLAPIVPDEADYAAAALGAAALRGDALEATRATARIEALDAQREGGPTGLAPAAADLLNATVAPGRAWRDGAAGLLARHDLDPALRARLERAREDDPLVVANARVRDARMTAFARAFNTLAEPIGQSVMSVALAPYRLARAVVSYGLYLYESDPLPLPRRQALAHWKEFLERYPDDPQAARVAAQAVAAQEKLQATLRRDALHEARQALDAGRPREGLLAAGRALRSSPESGGDEARALIARAEAEIERQRREQARSLRFAPDPEPAAFDADARSLAARILAGPDALLAVTDAAPAPLRPELAYARAAALAQRGEEAAAHDALVRVADGDPDRDPMVRHAEAALADPVRNPYDTFTRARWRDRRMRATWLLIGATTPVSPRWTPTSAIRSIISLPALAQTLVALPLRLVQWPWMPPVSTANVTAVQARRYLAWAPDGIHADEVRDWLESYESGRRNYVAALRVAQTRKDPGDLGELREEAARQALRVAEREERSDMRRAMLMEVARKFSGTESGDAAGRRAREELLEHTPQEIKLTRGFLLENPEVAGVRGLGLDPRLLDDDPRNAELHPDGVALIGGRIVEIRTIAPGGDDGDPPDRRRVEIDDAQLARVVARLEETSFRNALLDADDAVQPDPERDLAFERARLGLADQIDPRPTAEAHFTYEGMRERYGMVRRREPILPFDLVVQGSLADLSLGAFPRMRPPRPTPDALLYE